MDVDIDQLSGITRFRRDLLAGLTVASVAVPQAMAYALIAGIDPMYGLFTAIVVTALGSIFGSSPQLINGPTNAISVVVFSAIAGLQPLSPESAVAAVFLLAMLVGITQIVIALFKLGDLTRYVSESVLLGFMAGAGALIALSQLPVLMGITSRGEGHYFLYRLWEALFHSGQSIQWQSIVVGLVTVILIVTLRRTSKRIGIDLPELLIALLVMAVVVALTGWKVPLLGKVPRALPILQLPQLEMLNLVPRLSGSALAIAILGLLEALAIAKSISAKTRQPLDYNRQCLAEGLANLGGGFFQCMPGSGSLTRSAINFQAGAVTRWSGVYSAIAVAAVLLLFAPWAGYIPRPALAGLLLVTAWRLVDRSRLRYCWRSGRFDAILSITTACSVVFLSVEHSILVGTFLSFLLMMPKVARLQGLELVVSPERVVREKLPTDPQCDRIVLFSLEGELFFGAGPELQSVFEVIRKRVASGARVVLLRLRQARNPDMVCMEMLEELLREMKSKEIPVLLCGARAEMTRAMKTLRFHHWLPKEWIFPEDGAESATLGAVRYAYTLLQENLCDTCPRREPKSHGSESWYYMI